jgi:hypothetical protein
MAFTIQSVESQLRAEIYESSPPTLITLLAANASPGAGKSSVIILPAGVYDILIPDDMGNPGGGGVVSSFTLELADGYHSHNILINTIQSAPAGGWNIRIPSASGYSVAGGVTTYNMNVYASFIGGDTIKIDTISTRHEIRSTMLGFNGVYPVPSYYV